MLPIAALLGLIPIARTLRALPQPVASLGLLVAWAGSLYHAAKYARRGWVVLIALVWPSLLAYWIYVGLRLDRS